MGNKYNSINEDIFFTFFALSGLYLFTGNKYINLYTFVSVLIAKHGGILVRKILLHNDEKLEPGGTTPWNPLKIPGKTIKPANKV